MTIRDSTIRPPIGGTVNSSMNDPMPHACTPVGEQQIETAIDALIATHGTRPVRWFVGQMMINFKGKPNPAVVQKIAECKLATYEESKKQPCEQGDKYRHEQ